MLDRRLSFIVIIAFVLSLSRPAVADFASWFQSWGQPQSSDQAPHRKSHPLPALPEPKPKVLPTVAPNFQLPAGSTPASVDFAKALTAGLATGARLQIGSVTIETAKLSGLYQTRNYNPIFVGGQGLSAAAQSMRAVLTTLPAQHGLIAADYWSDELNSRWTSADPQALCELELLLSQNVYQLVSDLDNGRTNPQDPLQGIADIELHKRIFKDYAALNAAIGQATDQQSLATAIGAFAPQSAAYTRLTAELTVLNQVKAAGGWAPLGTLRKSLTVGAQDTNIPPVIPLIRARLLDLGMLTDASQRNNSGVLYDPELAQAVMAFQKANQQNPDGVIGRATFAALGMSLDHRIDQLRAVLERWRILPHDLGQDYIFVDLAHQTFKLYDSSSLAAGNSIPVPVLEMKVIVGQPTRQTPSFIDQITDVVIRPFWNAPADIIVKDVLPRAKADPDYFDEMHIQVFEQGREIDPSQLDWSQYSLSHPPPFRFREEPGPTNSLGVVKFNLSVNDHSIYMHDTNHHELFAQNLRLFSSGCIRLEKPLDLATYLLAPENISREQIEDMTQDPSIVAKYIHLRKPLRVYIVATSVSAVDPDGLIRFGQDVYGQDQRLINALNGERNEPGAPLVQSQAAP